MPCFETLLWKLGMLLLPIFPFGQSVNLCLLTEVGVGYREDCVDWNIAGLDNSPNILSELEWKDLRMFQLHGDVRLMGIGKLYVRGLADYGWIYQGKNRDSDYNGDDRTDEYMRSINNSGRGDAYDVLVGVGYPIISCFGLFVSPVGGYSFHEQHLHMYDGTIVIDAERPEREGSPIPGLESTYNNRWHSPFAGVDVMLNIGPLALFGEWQYHWVHFDGEGHWNLRRDFVDGFKDRAKGYGTRTSVRGQWRLSRCIYAGLGFDHWRMEGSDGISKVTVMSYLQNSLGQIVGKSPQKIETGFNEVHWRSWRINAVVSVVF